MRIGIAFGVAMIHSGLCAAAVEPSVAEESTQQRCAAVFEFQVSPVGALESFDFPAPVVCQDKSQVVIPTAAWRKTACGHFSTTHPRPTYAAGDPPKTMFSYYLINPARPDVIYPTATAGSSKTDSVYYVQESILKVEAKDVRACERFNDVGTAEALIDAFYSFDRSRLEPLMAAAESSKPDILYYQGWAEAGHYEVLKRAPCHFVEASKFACPITVKDDLIVALGLPVHVTDTFTLTFADGRIVAVETSSDDPDEYYEARKWVQANRPELVEVPCRDAFKGGPTPGDCVRGMVRGIGEYVASKPQGR